MTHYIDIYINLILSKSAKCIYYDSLSTSTSLNSILMDSVQYKCSSFYHVDCIKSRVCCCCCFDQDSNGHFHLIDRFIIACLSENPVQTQDDDFIFLLKHQIRMLQKQSSSVHYQLMFLSLFFNYFDYRKFIH